MKRVLGALALLLLAFGAVTWWALESGGVAVVETRPPGGGTRETHVWYVSEGDTLWLEAGTPDNAWFRDVQRDPRVRLRIGSELRDYVAHVDADPAGQARLRAALRRKYGLRDRWVGLFVDPAGTVPVRLVPAAGESVL